MTAGCFSQHLTDTSKQCRQAGMATIIEEHAAVVPVFSSFVYPGSHSHTDMCTCGQGVRVCFGGGRGTQLRFLHITSNRSYTADFLVQSDHCA